MEDDWPTHTAELVRKATQTAEKWVDRHAAGKVTDRDLFLVVDALYDATSGIVPKVTSDMLLAIRKELLNGR